MVNEFDQAARSVAPFCPRCEQGQVFPAKIGATGELVQVCEECDASWFATETLSAVRFRDLGTLLRERGLSPLWDGLAVPALRRRDPDRSRIRNGALPRPVLVTGVVTRHEHDAFYLDIGVEQDGLVVIEDDSGTPAELPRVGRVVQAALLGRTGTDAQPHLTVRPSDLAAAREPGSGPQDRATSNDAVEPEPELVLPDDFDDYAWEVEAKGCLLDATVRWSGYDFVVSFYDPVRLAQTIASDLEQSSQTAFDRLVVLSHLTREGVCAAARALPPGFFGAESP